jgi:histidine triad (HIT) family protein
MPDCIFCKIVKNEIPAEKIYEDENFLAFLDVHPVNQGHTLIIPKKHIDYIFELEEPLYSRAFQLAKKLSKPIQNAVNSKRIGLAVEGFGVPHVHIHLIPVNNVNELDPNRAKKEIPKDLSKIAEKIKTSISLV